MNELGKTFSKKDEIFEDDAYEWGPEQITEEQVVRASIGRVVNSLTTYKSGNKTLELPGLQNNLKMLIAAAAHFREEVAGGEMFELPEHAGTNSPVITFASPQLYSQHGNVTGFDSFQQTGFSAGNTYNVVPSEADADGTVGQLRDDEYLFFTGDFVDLNADAITTRAQYVDVDQEDYNPSNHYLSERNTDAQVSGPLPGAWCRFRYDIDALAALSGDTEYLPVAFAITTGGNLPNLDGSATL